MRNHRPSTKRLLSGSCGPCRILAQKVCTPSYESAEKDAGGSTERLSKNGRAQPEREERVLSSSGREISLSGEVWRMIRSSTPPCYSKGLYPGFLYRFSGRFEMSGL